MAVLRVILTLSSWLAVSWDCLNPGPAVVYRDLRYYNGPDAGPQHVLDLYLPADGRNGFPTIVFVHGGSWHTGDKDNPFYPYQVLGTRFAARGIAVAVVDYRLSPGVRHPAHVLDAARAFAWTRRSIASYGGDPKRVFLVGHSAGAHLVMLLSLDPRYLASAGCHPRDVAGVVALSGPYDLTYLWDAAPWFSRKFILEPAFGRDPSAYAAASPVRYARGASPPALLAYAQYDHPGFGEESRHLGAVLAAAGAAVQVYELPGRTHFTEITELGREGDYATALILNFVRQPPTPPSP